MTETSYDQERMREIRRRLKEDVEDVEEFVLRKGHYKNFDEDNDLNAGDATAAMYTLAHTVTWAQLICDFDEEIPELQAEIDYARSLLTKSLCEHWLVPFMEPWVNIVIPSETPAPECEPSPNSAAYRSIRDDITFGWRHSWEECLMDLTTDGFVLEYLMSVGCDMSVHDSEREKFEAKLFAMARHCPWSIANFEELWIGMYHISMLEEKPHLNILVRFLDKIEIRYIDRDCPVWKLLNQ